MYLDTDKIVILLALYATRIELKSNNQDEVEVCTLSTYSVYNCNLNMFWSAAKIIQNCACVKICIDKSSLTLLLCSKTA